MKDLYYVNEKQERVGPIDLTEVPLHPIREETMVWRKGMAQWEYAGSLPEVRQYLSSSAVPPIPNCQSSSHTYEPPTYCMDKPSSYLWLSILTTICCCLPLGIVGIIYSSKVDGLWMQGRYDEAKGASRKAVIWSLIGVACSIIVWILYMVFWVALFAESGDLLMETYNYESYY